MIVFKSFYYEHKSINFHCFYADTCFTQWSALSNHLRHTVQHFMIKNLQIYTTKTNIFHTFFKEIAAAVMCLLAVLFYNPFLISCMLKCYCHILVFLLFSPLCLFGGWLVFWLLFFVSVFAFKSLLWDRARISAFSIC